MDLPVNAFKHALAARRERPRRHSVQRIAVPPAVLVRLAEPKRPLGHDAVEEALVVDPEVPRTIAADLHVRRIQHLFAELP